MNDVTGEVIADVQSTLQVNFPIAGLQDFGAATKKWKVGETTLTIPATCQF